MFLSEREFQSSQIYNKFDFIRKEGLPLSVIFALIVLALKISDFRKSELNFNSSVFFIFFTSVLLIILGGLISSYIRYEIYTDNESKLGKTAFFLQYFINLYLIILSGVVMRFDFDLKKIGYLMLSTLIICVVASIITSHALHKTWNKKLTELRKKKQGNLKKTF